MQAVVEGQDEAKPNRKSNGNGVGKGTNTRDMFRDRAAGSLLIAHHLGGWITTTIMANVYWPKASAGKKYAERLMAEMVTQGLLLRRELPNRMSAGVVTTKGARFVQSLEMGQAPDVRVSTAVSLKPGTDWGRMEDGTWTPPVSWRHQLRAGNFLTWFAYKHAPGEWMAFDMQIQRENTLALKRPDGMLYRPEKTDDAGLFKSSWVEVESARKTGPELTKLILNLIEVTNGKALSLVLTDEEGQEQEHVFEKNYLVVPAGYDIEAFQRRALARMAPGSELKVEVAVEGPDYGFTLQSLSIMKPKLEVAQVPAEPAPVSAIDPTDKARLKEMLLANLAYFKGADL